MDKSTGYLKYFEAPRDDESCKTAEAFSPDMPDLLAFRNGDKLFLGQLRTERHTSMTSTDEILSLLDKLDVNGKLVTVNAFNITMAVSKKLREAGADYVITLKGKHQNLYVDAIEYFQELLSAEAEEFKYDSVKKMDKPEGEKTEPHYCYTSSDVSWLHYRRDWADLKSLAMIMRETKENDKLVRRAGYYVSNLAAEPENFIPAARRCWGRRKIIWCISVEDRV
jgi:predicted transposase YbfD/YdcC